MQNIGFKKIALSGSASVGKTTFANDFSTKYGYPLIIEGVREWIRDNNITNFLEMTSEQKHRMQLDVLESKIKTESSLDFFIADRSTLDNAIYGLSVIPENEIENYLSKCIEHAKKTYDLIVFFPTGLIPFEDDGLRYPNKSYQLRISYMIRGLLDESGIDKIVIKNTNRLDRITEVSEKLFKM